MGVHVKDQLLPREPSETLAVHAEGERPLVVEVRVGGRQLHRREDVVGEAGDIVLHVAVERDSAVMQGRGQVE